MSPDNGAMMEWERDGYRISTDKSELSLELIHNFLRGAYWSRGISRERVEQSIAHSACYGLFAGNDQIGFARLITDEATFAYLSDVFVLEAHRGKGLGRWLMSVVMQRPSLGGIRRIMLATADAHALYAGFGFSALENPGLFMEIRRASVRAD